MKQSRYDRLTLGQLIWLVRRELEWARQVDADHALRFEVDSVDLDVTIEVEETTAGGGGLNLAVFGVGGSGNLSHESAQGSTQVVHVVLKPHGPAGKIDIGALDVEPPPRSAESVPDVRVDSDLG